MGWLAFAIMTGLWVLTVSWVVYLIQKVEALQLSVRLKDSELMSHRQGTARWPR